MNPLYHISRLGLVLGYASGWAQLTPSEYARGDRLVTAYNAPADIPTGRPWRAGEVIPMDSIQPAEDHKGRRPRTY